MGFSSELVSANVSQSKPCKDTKRLCFLKDWRAFNLKWLQKRVLCRKQDNINLTNVKLIRMWLFAVVRERRKLGSFTCGDLLLGGEI